MLENESGTPAVPANPVQSRQARIAATRPPA
jgi:hypothetical protein